MKNQLYAKILSGPLVSNIALLSFLFFTVSAIASQVEHASGTLTSAPSNTWVPVNAWQEGRHYWMMLDAKSGTITVITSQRSKASNRPGYWISERALQMTKEFMPLLLEFLSIGETCTIEGVQYREIRLKRTDISILAM